WGLGSKVIKEMPNIQASFDIDSADDFEKHRQTLMEGLNLFNLIFGNRADSFIPNNYVFPKELYSTLKDLGIKYIQGNYYQLLPTINNTIRKKKFRYTGLTNNHGLLNLVRNVTFEPFENQNSLNKCLSQIEKAFFWNKPAIIASHRA